jgi:hypothetical protein
MASPGSEHSWLGGMAGRRVMRIVHSHQKLAAHGMLTADGNVVGQFTPASSLGLPWTWHSSPRV